MSLNNFNSKPIEEYIHTTCKFLGKETLLRLTSGKYARSILSYLLSGGKTPVEIMAAIEVAHSATLFHDDVIDKDETRRGFKSLHLVKNNKWAILDGDLSLIQSIQMINSLKDNALTHYFLKTIEDTCKGEILQQRSMSETDYSFDKYYETVLLKTGSFFGFAAVSGIYYRNQKNQIDPEEINLLFRNLGGIYQMMDDFEDCFIEETALSDFTNNNLTLPFVILFGSVNPAEFLALEIEEKRKVLESHNVQVICQDIIDSKLETLQNELSSFISSELSNEVMNVFIRKNEKNRNYR
jgi:geranylgeranyl pyrophosphate synthase